ncbi:MAG: glycoside hydrolase family 5 protein [Chloroflexi bacterium]|nr:glycoside hydrolase family 5 protein [Chloroflexota bacterium]
MLLPAGANKQTIMVGMGKSTALIAFLIVAFLFSSCRSPISLVTYEESLQGTPTLTASLDMHTIESIPDTSSIRHKIDLWSAATPMLRGVNIWQALVIPAVDGESKGTGHVGPPFSQQDFDLLAELGANYVVISAPGLFTENPPYGVDSEVQHNLDNLLDMLARADLFATIAFRTGPGKAEWSLCCSDVSYYNDYFNDTVWSDPQAQTAWAEMWQYTADRYKDNPVVVGYKLMVEPNAADILYGIDSPGEFFRAYSGSLSDWVTFYPKIVSAIREVDNETPILVGADGYSSVAWLPYLTPADAENMVYVAHQYMPYDTYTHQSTRAKNSYPSQFDVNNDGDQENFDKHYLSNLLQPVRQYQKKYTVPIAIDEFGVKRWVPGAADYLIDLLDLFEQAGWNYAIWEWSTGFEPFGVEVDNFNYKLGTDPSNKSLRLDNPLLQVLRSYWSLNSIRPSSAPW